MTHPLDVESSFVRPAVGLAAKRTINLVNISGRATVDEANPTTTGDDQGDFNYDDAAAKHKYCLLRFASTMDQIDLFSLKEISTGAQVQVDIAVNGTLQEIHSEIQIRAITASFLTATVTWNTLPTHIANSSGYQYTMQWRASPAMKNATGGAITSWAGSGTTYIGTERHSGGPVFPSSTGPYYGLLLRFDDANVYATGTSLSNLLATGKIGIKATTADDTNASYIYGVKN